MENNKDSKRPSRIANLFHIISVKCGNIQKRLSEKSQEYGYSKDVFEQAGLKYRGVTDDPIFDGVERMLAEQLKFIEHQEEGIGDSLKEARIDSLAFVTTTTAGVTLSTISDNFVSERVNFPVSWTFQRKKELIDKFSELDPELGKTYSSVREVFYGTVEAPEKNALSAMRQVFDHFFRIVAPDEEVRNSPFFSKKEGEKPDQVYRIERLRYVANTKVMDKEIAGILSLQAEQIIKIYEKLNQLHTEKKLDRNQVSEVLLLMESSLEVWVDAINISY